MFVNDHSHAHYSDDADSRACLEACMTCQQSCLETASIHCLEIAGSRANARLVRLLLDCAEMCQTSANFLVRGSDLRGYTCGLCSHVCHECAEECATISGDARLEQCRSQCIHCVEQCLRLSKLTAGMVLSQP